MAPAICKGQWEREAELSLSHSAPPPVFQPQDPASLGTFPFSVHRDSNTVTPARPIGSLSVTFPSRWPLCWAPDAEGHRSVFLAYETLIWGSRRPSPRMRPRWKPVTALLFPCARHSLPQASLCPGMAFDPVPTSLRSRPSCAIWSGLLLFPNSTSHLVYSKKIHLRLKSARVGFCCS